MKLVNTLFLAAMALAFVMPHAAASKKVEDDQVLYADHAGKAIYNFPLSPKEEPFPLRGLGRPFFPQINPRGLMCNKNPRVCQAKGSPGPDCCKKNCVNVMTDWLNCGLCGKKCGYGQVCCKGKCVSVLFDNKNCGRCNNKCKKGHFCVFGLCNYAN